MKSFKSILCASVMTLAMSSATFAGTIYGAPTGTGDKTGTIYGAPGTIYGAPGTGKSGTIYGAPGTIYGIADEAYSELVGLVTGILG